MIKHFKTAQEACDYSVKQIVAQGGRCVSNDYCRYSDGQGHHCGIGWLLDPDDKDLMNYVGYVHHMIEGLPNKVPQIIKDNVGLFGTLQEFHDEDYSIIREMCRDGLRDNYNIDTSAPHWQQWVDMGEE